MVTVLSAVAAAAVAGYLVLGLLVRRAYRVPRVIETGTPADAGLPYRTVSVPTANGRRLFGWYIPPQPAAPERAGGVVAIHGWGGNAEFMLPFAALLHRAGHATLLIDARSHGRSDADTFASLPSFAEDLEHGFEWLAAQPEVDQRRLALLGHSVGAAAALLVASRRGDVAAVVSIAAFAHPEELMRRQMRLHRIPHLPVGWAALRYIERAIGHRYEAIAPINTIRGISCPVLLVHGDADRSVPVADALAIHDRRPHGRVELLVLPDTDHDSTERIEQHGGELVTFLDRALRGRAESP